MRAVTVASRCSTFIMVNLLWSWFQFSIPAADISFEQLASFGPGDSPGQNPGALSRGADGELYGTTSVGVAGANGTIFRVSTNTLEPEILFEFPETSTQQKLLVTRDGDIYGWTHFPGDSVGGRLFRFQPDSKTFQPLITAAEARTRGWRELVHGSDDRIYAIAGAQIVRIDRDGTGFRSIYTNTSGLGPDQLFEGSDGKLYAVEPHGAIFRLEKDGAGLEILRDFVSNPVPGASSPRAVFEASDGFLYGTLHGITFGTAPVRPKIFRMSRDGTEFSIIRELESFPQGNLTYGNLIDALIEGPDGYLYGTLPLAGLRDPGYAFRVTKNGTDYSKLFDFPAEYLAFDEALNVNRSTTRTLTVGGDGLIYGTTLVANSAPGFLYRFNPDGTGFTTLYAFQLPDNPGENPDSALTAADDGLFFGTTRAGGPQRGGTVYRFRAGDGLSAIKAFSLTATNGGLTPAGVILGDEGRLYGVTSRGGSAGFGTIFTVATNGSDFRILRSFLSTGADGRVPEAALLEGSDGILYGSTTFGGGAAAGTLFKISKDGTGYEVLARFTNSVSGSNVVGQLIEGSDGRLYGSTVFAGPRGGGTLFALAKAGAGFTLLHSFAGAGTELRNPKGKLVQGPDGMLYGTASAGGSAGFGGIFRIRPDGSGFEVVRAFSATGEDGRVPESGLAFAPDGFIYGTTRFGGGAVNGSIYRIRPDGSEYEKVEAFSGGNEGGNPVAALVPGNDGSLYGVTSEGGKTGAGTLFRLRFGSELPMLAIRQVSPLLIELTWPADQSRFQLESTGDLRSPIAWRRIEGAAVEGDVWRFQVNPSLQRSFYRLVAQ